MYKNLYVLIIIIPIVQIIMCKTIENDHLARDLESKEYLVPPSQRSMFAHSTYKEIGKGIIRNSRERYDRPNDKADSRNIDSGTGETTTNSATKRSSGSTIMFKPHSPKPRTAKLNATDKSLNEIKFLLSEVLDQIANMKHEDSEFNISTTSRPRRQSSGLTKGNHLPTISSRSVKKKKQDNSTSEKRIRWGHWTEWSSCSVSCGKGRQIRWRHCIENCSEAETEMEEKTCQLPACAPGKLFGVLKI